MKRLLAALLAAAVLCPLTALAAGEKNVDNLPVGNLEGFESSITWFGEDFAYDITDEEACWELLQRPITVLDVSEKEVVYPRVSPDGEKVVNEWMGGSINGSLAAVHVLGEDEDGWTLIEGMDYYDRIIRGYVKNQPAQDRDAQQQVWHHHRQADPAAVHVCGRKALVQLRRVHGSA